MAIDALALVLALLVANMLFNQGMMALGYGLPYASFLPDPADAYGDYLKFVLSYPGGSAVRSSNLFDLHRLIVQYQTSNPYAGAAGLAGTSLTHLHATPITTLFCLLNVAAMKVVDPVVMFVGIMLALLAYWSRIVCGAVRSGRERLVWIALGTLGYPTLIMVARGNVYAGAAALLIVHAMLLAIRGRSHMLSAVLLAVAIGIRPNAAVFVVPMLLLAQQHRWRMLATIAVAGMLSSGGALAAAHLLYPDYTPASFLAGLGRYHRIYVVGDQGLAFGSSLFGALKLLFGAVPGLDTLAAIPALIVLAAAVWLRATRALPASGLLFLTAAAYCLGSAVIADYHLIVFVVVPMALAIEARDRPVGCQDWVAAGAACLILAPKNYVFGGDVSAQIMINPMILLGAARLIIRRTQETEPGSAMPIEQNGRGVAILPA